MGRLGGWSETLREHPRTLDAALAFLVMAVGLLAPLLSRHPQPTAPYAVRVVTAAIAFGLLLCKYERGVPPL